MITAGTNPLSLGSGSERSSVFSELEIVDTGVSPEFLKKTLRKLEGFVSSVEVRDAGDFFRRPDPARGLTLILSDDSWIPEAAWIERLRDGRALPPFVFVTDGVSAERRKRFSFYASWGVLSLKAGDEEWASSLEAIRKKACLLRDARKDLEFYAEERKALLRELHHRVKNNFQLILSMLHLKIEGLEEGEPLRRITDFRNYLMTMAAIHERLYRSSGFPRIELNEILQDILRELISSFSPDLSRVSLRSEVDRFSLPLDTAVPVAIVLTELVTNVFKHAFPPMSGKKGNLLVRAVRRDEANATISVEDDGVGLSGNFLFSSAPTLGFTILRVLVKQLCGTIRYENVNPGARFILTIPLDENP